MKIKDIIVESSLNEAPAGGYRLVRVVDGLDNIQANTDGSLTAIARFNGHSQRNTLHFTVNSMVGDHNMGKFPGKYVVIANPAEMPRDQAAGARAEDTWYRFNNEGEINLGRAIVLAPEGSSVPNGIKAQYYKGDRGTAIDTAFKQMGVGFHGVAGTDSVIGIRNDEYYKDFSTQHGTGATQGGQHDGSLEGYLESIPARLQGYLGHLQKSIYYEPPGERETFVTSYANGIIDNFRDDINKWATANPQEFKVSATYFNYIIQVMDAYQAIFTQAQQAYNQQYQDYLTAEKQWKASNQPRPGEPPPLDPAPHPQMATWPPPGLNLQIPKIQLSYAKKNPQGVTEGVYRGDWVRHPDNPWQIGQIQSIDNGQAAVTWKKTDKRKKAMSSTHAVDALQHARREFSQLTQPTHTPGMAEGKVKLHTDPGYFGAEVDDTGFDSLPVVNIPANKLVGFEPDSKMNQPKSQANVEKIVAGLKKGDKLPPLLVRKYKNGYQVLDGHHRFWAYKLSGTKSIPVRIVADKDIEEIGKQGVAEGLLNFEEGDCPIFAIALHRLSKMPLMALVEYDEQMGSTVLIHAYVKLDDRWRLDASGETDVNWMLQKYPNNGNAEEIEISEKDLLELGYGKSKCPTLQQVLPYAKEVLQNIEEGQQGVAEGSEQEGLVSQFLKSITPKELRYYSIRDNCGPAALHMMDWAKEKGIKLNRVHGYFVADNVVYNKADFTKEMKHEFLQQGLDFNDPKSRREFIASNPKYSKEWKKVPHYWLQDDQGTVYDPTGYTQFIKTGLAKDLDKSRYETVQGVVEGLDTKENPDDQVRNKLNAWMEQDQQFTDPTQRAGFQSKVWPYIQKNIQSILSDKGEKGNGDYPAAPYAAWLLVQHMDAYPQNQIEFYNALKQAIPDHPKIQFLRDRAAVNRWIMKNASNPEYFIKGKALPNPTVNVRNPAMFKDAGIVATSREEALQNAQATGNKLLVAAVQATNAQTQPSYKQGVTDDESLDEGLLGNMLPWPEVVNKINSAMRAMGWKGQRKDDGSFIFTTRGAMTNEYYIVIIDNEGDSMFTYALGTVEEGDPHIGEQDTLPTTEASVSELMNAVRDGFGLNENFADGRNPGRKGLAKRSGVNTKASVSSLRKTAKNSSGEKQRMAHWLANMKAGRAKARKK